MADQLLSLLAPEIILAVGACVVLFSGAARNQSWRSATGLLAIVAVFVSFATAWFAGAPANPISVGGLLFTSLGWYVRLIALAVGLFVVLVHWHLPAEQERGEAFSMILFSLLGIMLTGLADDLVVLFLAVELVSVPTYVLVSIGRGDIRAQEAGVKYFFLGALSAGMMAYGFSFIYGVYGTTVLSNMQAPQEFSAFLPLGLVLAFAGIAFKIAAVPFHFYVADVYQGAASPVTGLLGYFPKLSGFVALIKLLMILPEAGAPGAGWDMPHVAFWFLWIVAAATMTFGNMLGLMQNNVKRMLAYSSIAHSGYMLLALLVGPVDEGGPLRDGLSAMLFYIVVYGFMNLGAFAVLSLLHIRGRSVEELSDLTGVGRRQPLLGLALAVCVFSLIGMPPTAGFIGKVYVFSAAFSVGTEHMYNDALILLGIIGIINAAIAAAYYLRIIGACYMRDEPSEVDAIRPATGTRIGLVGCCVAVLLFGLQPRGLIRLTPQPYYELRGESMLSTQAMTEQPTSIADPTKSLDEQSGSEQMESPNSSTG